MSKKTILDKILEKKFSNYKNISEDEKYDFWINLPKKTQYEINSEELKLIGKKEYDYINCIEQGRLYKYESLFDYPTLYEFDKSWWEFQKQTQKENIQKDIKLMQDKSDIKTLEKITEIQNKYEINYSEYKINMRGVLFRIIENNKLLYSEFISIYSYIYYKIEDEIHTEIKQKIPYTYKCDENNLETSFNKKNPFDIYYNAQGRELELDSLNDKIEAYKNFKLEKIIEKYVSKYIKVFSGKTFRIDTGYEKDNFNPFTSFIFFDEKSLKKIRIKHFLQDFKKCQLEYNKLENIIEDIYFKIKQDFEIIYEKNHNKFCN